MNLGRSSCLGSPGDGEVKGSPFAGFGFDPDPSAIAFNHALTDCQTDAGTAVLLGVVQPLEYSKDFLLILRIDPDPIVLHRKAPELPAPLRRDMNSWR